MLNINFIQLTYNLNNFDHDLDYLTNKKID